VGTGRYAASRSDFGVWYASLQSPHAGVQDSDGHPGGHLLLLLLGLLVEKATGSRCNLWPSSESRVAGRAEDGVFLPSHRIDVERHLQQGQSSFRGYLCPWLCSWTNQSYIVRDLFAFERET